MSIAGYTSVQAKQMRIQLAERSRVNRETAARQTTTAPTGPSVSPEARTAIQNAMAQYREGGGFGQGVEAGLERGRTQAVSSGMQNLVSSGLAGTTIAGGLGKKYEEEVAAPTRANLASVRAERISALQTMLAEMAQGGYQAGLGRRFAASESSLNRSFSADQSTLNRGMSRMSPGGGQPMSARPQPPTPLERPNAGLSAGLYASSGSMPQYTGASGYQSPFMQSATEAYSPASKTPGDYVGSMNGQRYIYNQGGIPIRA